MWYIVVIFSYLVTQYVCDKAGIYEEGWNPEQAFQHLRGQGQDFCVKKWENQPRTIRQPTIFTR